MPSCSLITMASQLSEAEERDRVFSGKGRWNQVRSITDAKSLMNYLFDIASSSRCLLRDKEVICREKDMEIRDLKENVFRLSTALKQSEMIRAELTRQLKLQNATLKRYSESVGNSEFANMTIGGQKYDLCNPEHRRSTLLLEDMDISDIESDDYDDDMNYDVEATDHELEESGTLRFRKRKSKSRHPSNENNQLNINRSEDAEDNSRDGLGETASAMCCSCSRTSSCKTKTCKCKAMGSSCGSSCGCLAAKCDNRALSTSNESQVPAQFGFIETTENKFSIEENNEDRLLATQGAELLQGALADRPAEINTDQGPRKPLSDIGNALVKSNAPKGTQKKKLQKATILLVPDPSRSSQPENSAVPNPKKQNDGTNYNIRETNIAADIPLKMPSSRPENAASAPKAEGNFMEPVSPLKLRAMRKAAAPSNSGVPFWDRNASKSGESVNYKNEPEIGETRSPL